LRSLKTVVISPYNEFRKTGYRKVQCSGDEKLIDGKPLMNEMIPEKTDINV
jgi:hypothetical protein